MLQDWFLFLKSILSSSRTDINIFLALISITILQTNCWEFMKSNSPGLKNQIGKVGSMNCCLFLNWIATKIYHQLIALKASLNPVCFVGCTYSPKHRNCKVFSVNLIQISVTQDQISWLNNGRTPKKSIFWLIQSCSPRTNSWKKNLA